MSIFHEFPVLVPLVTWVFVQTFKVVRRMFQKNFRLTWQDITQSGGFPSAHTAFVMSMTTVVFIKEGIDSLLFAIVLPISILIMFDAIRVRYEAGRHAAELNKMLGEKKYIERLGHTPFQVFAGIIFGVGISFFLLSL